MSRTTRAAWILGLFPAFAYAAPADPDEVPDARTDAPVSPPVATHAPARIPKAFVGVGVGAVVPLAHLRPALFPDLEGGIVLPVLEGRLQPYLALSYAAPSQTGTLSDDAFPDGYDWDLHVRTYQATIGVRARLSPWTESLSPDFSLGPVLALVEPVVGGTAGGSDFPASSERFFVCGVHVGAGVEGRAGPGQVELQIGFDALPLSGALTGATLLPNLAPSLGYRIDR
jgi:hypothetical protein